MAELSTLTLELEPYLLKEIDRLAAYEAEGRMAVVREALVRHIETMTEMEDLKQLAAEKYLNQQLSFDQLARIVGYDYALEIQTGKRILEVSLASAQKDSASSEGNG